MSTSLGISALRYQRSVGDDHDEEPDRRDTAVLYRYLMHEALVPFRDFGVLWTRSPPDRAGTSPLRAVLDDARFELPAPEAGLRK